MAQKRLLKELQNSTNDLPTGIYVECINNNVFDWKGYVIGPADTPYAGFVYELRLSFPEEYPFKPPKVCFTTRIFHPNIGDPTGEICIDILADRWAPGLTGCKVLLSIQSLLAQPNPDDPLNPAAAAIFKNNQDKFMERVVWYANEFCVKIE